MLRRPRGRLRQRPFRFDLDIVRDALNSENFLRSILRGNFFGVMVHLTGQGHDAVVRGHSDVRRSDARSPCELRNALPNPEIARVLSRLERVSLKILS